MALTMQRSNSGLGSAGGQRSSLGRSGSNLGEGSGNSPSSPTNTSKPGQPVRAGSASRRKPSYPCALGSETPSGPPAKSNSRADLFEKPRSQPHSPGQAPKSASGRRDSGDKNGDAPQSAGGTRHRPSSPSLKMAGSNIGAQPAVSGPPGASSSVKDQDIPAQPAKDKESEPSYTSRRKDLDQPAKDKESEPSSLMKRRMQKPLAVETTRTSQRKAVFKVLAPEEKITDFFDTNEQIYEGGNKGKVMKAKRKGKIGDEADCVLKIRYKRGDKESERVWRTVMEQLMMSKNSDHVLDLQEIFEDEKAFYIIMPNCTGGELFEFLLNETEVPEVECKRIIREILFALQDLHSKGLIHRDVKPENIMFSNEEVGPNTSKSAGSGKKNGGVKLLNGETSPHTSKTVKLIDFDTCQPWTPESPKNGRFAGTPGYIAPESLLGNPGPESDLWSVGVILYILMTGDMPWNGPLPELENAQVNSPSAKKMYDHLKGEEVDWTSPPWPEFPKARDLCQKLLKFEATQRISTAEEALKHPWLRES